MTDVGIGIISYNHTDDLKRCLSSVIEATDVPYTICIHDNSEDQRNKRFLQDVFPQIPVTSRGKNVGCAIGRNCMWEFFKANHPDMKHMAVLDQDMIVKPGWLGDMLSVMESKPSAGIVCWPQFTTCRPDDEGEVKEVGGGATLHRMELLEQTGGWDERFFMFRFDSWICLLAKSSGWKTCVVTKYGRRKRGYNASKDGVEHRHPHRAVRSYPAWREEQVKSHALYKRLVKAHHLEASDPTPSWPWPARREGSNWIVQRGGNTFTVPAE